MNMPPVLLFHQYLHSVDRRFERNANLYSGEYCVRWFQLEI